MSTSSSQLWAREMDMKSAPQSCRSRDHSISELLTPVSDSRASGSAAAIAVTDVPPMHIVNPNSEVAMKKRNISSARSCLASGSATVVNGVTIPSLKTLSSELDALTQQFASLNTSVCTPPRNTATMVVAPASQSQRLCSAPSRRRAPLHLAPIGASGLADQENDEVVDRLSCTADIISLKRETLAPRSVTPPASVYSPLNGRLGPAAVFSAAATPVVVMKPTARMNTRNGDANGNAPCSVPRTLGRRGTSRPQSRSPTQGLLVPPPEDSPISGDKKKQQRRDASPSTKVAVATNGVSSSTEDAALRPVSPRSLAAAKQTRDGRIKVAVRKRPLGATEAGADCVSVDAPATLRLTVTKQRIDLSEYEESSEFTFDCVFDEKTNNETVYRDCAGELIDVALSGGSASCFAYGQTGSGKTYTMMGGEEEKGLYLLGAAELFARASATHTFSVSFYEIYCNSLFDLLNDRFPVVVREDGNKRVNICGLTWHTFTSATELWNLVGVGMEQRRSGSTSANERSSRSHAVMAIQVRDTSAPEMCGMMNFVDLAGSERAADTANNDKQTRLEGAEINKSLLALKECIRALDEKKKHVPFRGSRLTEVLRDSFTGNSKTIMIANISPSALNFEHTANTLRYAFRVKGLSIPSVAPSKARNAPRPYPGITRSRSNLSGVAAAQAGERGNTPSSINASPLQGKSSNIIGAGGVAGAQRSPPRGPSAKRRRGVGSRLQFNRDDEGAPLTGDAEDRSSGNGLPSLLGVRDTSPQREATRQDIYFSEHHASNSGGSFISPSDLQALEEKVKRQVMRQLQLDLGREIQHVLDERDAIIAALRRENAKLKDTVAELQTTCVCGRRSGVHSDAPQVAKSTLPIDAAAVSVELRLQKPGARDGRDATCEI